MTKKHTVTLLLFILLFVFVSALFVVRAIQFNKTHYRIGAVPPEIVNQLLPKTVPIAAMHPPAIRAMDPVRYGNATSLISIIEYGDFQCEYCRALDPEIKNVVEPYRGKVRFVWRDFPIEELHRESVAAAVFARCAGLQGKFWEAYDALMKTTTLGDRAFREIGDRLRMDRPLLDACRRDPNVEALVRRDMEEARADGVKSVPFLFVGTQAFEGLVDAETLKRAVETALASL